MRKSVHLLIVFCLSVLPSMAQYRQTDVYGGLYDSETVAAMKNHIGELSAASLEGRKAGSDGEKAAAAYVRDVLKGYGVDLLSPVEGDKFGIKTEKGDTLTSQNIIGFVQGYDPELRNKYIVVGARLDNMGTMTMTVDGTPVEKIYYGANGGKDGADEFDPFPSFSPFCRFWRLGKGLCRIMVFPGQVVWRCCVNRCHDQSGYGRYRI